MFKRFILNQTSPSCLFKLDLNIAIARNDYKLFHVSNAPTLSTVNVKRFKKTQEKNKKLISINNKPSILIRAQMTVGELASSLNRPSEHVFDCLDKLNYVYGNKRDSFRLNMDLIIKIVKLSGFRHRFDETKKIDLDEKIIELMEKDDSHSKRSPPKPSDLIRRSPVVTIMGHVDHGKTTLLDSLRGSNVVEKEFGGITQHIGAFNTRLSSLDDKRERAITFLDTPGHAAFSAMRSRGAKVTDIVVLVIAAEDGVMAQTIESIEHAKGTSCKIIVAINKIDKVNEEQVKKVKRELLNYDLIPEEMGGEVQVVPISALKKINLDLLKEEIWARSEIMDLKGDPNGLVEGYIIESTQDLHKGKLATVLIKRGTLKKGDFLVAGQSWCKVKFIYDENSKNLEKASLSQAVQIMGWKEVPHSGDEVVQVSSESRAKELVEIRNQIEALKKQKSESEIIEKKRTEHNNLYRDKHMVGLAPVLLGVFVFLNLKRFIKSVVWPISDVNLFFINFLDRSKGASDIS